MNPENEHVAKYLVACEGPSLDYTSRARLYHADIGVMDEGDDWRSEPMRRSRMLLRVVAGSPEGAIAIAKDALAGRPYAGFEVVDTVLQDERLDVTRPASH